EFCVVNLHFGQGGEAHDLRVHRLCLFLLSGLCVGARQQAGGAMEVVVVVGGNDPLEIRDGACVVAEADGAERAAIVGIDPVPPGGDGAIEANSRLLEVTTLKVQVAEFLVVGGRGIYGDFGLKLADALPARKHPKGVLQQSQIGRRLHYQVHQRAQSAAQDDNPQPVGIGTAADEVNHRQTLQQNSPGIDQIGKVWHGRG